MSVKSWVDHPSGTEKLKAGTVQVTGVAFAGTQPIEKVEVSTDGGKTWREARFIGPDLGPYAWRTFVIPVELSAGQYTVASRATDSAGNTQPAERLENERGYANNSWRDHAIQITVG
jgi:sulfite dehydrogenase